MRQVERDYGWQGRLGVGTPQANPTVEAEMRRLIPIGVEYFTVRLTSDSPDSKKRVYDYIELLPDYVTQYATLKVDAFLFACTGSSYLVGRDRSDALRDEAAEKLGAPVIMASDAIESWLKARQAEKLALISPYPEWLNSEALDYWRECGFDIVQKAVVDIGSDNTDRIYEQNSADAARVLEPLLDLDVDSYLVSGTGMPSLPLLKRLHQTGKVAVSSNLALADLGLKQLGLASASADQWIFGS